MQDLTQEWYKHPYISVVCEDQLTLDTFTWSHVSLHKRNRERTHMFLNIYSYSVKQEEKFTVVIIFVEPSIVHINTRLGRRDIFLT